MEPLGFIRETKSHVETRRFRPGPYVNGVVRGFLTFDLLGFGLGSFAAPIFGLAFDSGTQWNFTYSGAALGMLLGLAWGRRHQS